MIKLFNQPNISKHPTCKPKVEVVKVLNSSKFVFIVLQLPFVVAGTVLIASLDFIHKTYNILFLARVSMRIGMDRSSSLS